MRILFVCSGNICRSPMAAEYARSRLAASGLSHVVVDSAGTLGIEGERPCRDAIDVSREAGLDLSRHRSRGVTAADLKTADLIVVMALDHLNFLERSFPGYAAPTFLLRAFERGPAPADGAPDLDDPIGRPIEFCRAQFERMRRCVDHMVLHLKHSR